MVDFLPNAFVLHHINRKAVKENLRKVKGSTLHKVVQDELVRVRQ